MRVPRGRLRLSSLRVQLIALLLLLALPTIALLTYSSLERRDADEAAARAEAVRLAQSYDDRVRSNVESARQLLRPLAAFFGGVESLEDVKEEACQSFLAPLAEEAGYTSVAVVLLDGRYLCASSDVPSGSAPSSTVLERLLVLEQAPVVLGVTISPLTKTFVIPVMQGIRNRQGQLTGAMVINLDPRSFAPTSLVELLPPGSFATIVDDSGRIISRYPDPDGTLVGQSVTDNPAFQTMMRERTGSLVAESVQGVDTIIGYRPLTSGDGGMVIVGIARDAIVSASATNLRRNFLGLFLATGAVAAIAWIGTERVLLVPLRRSQLVASSVAAGDLSVRVAPDYAFGDLGEFEREIDAMASAVETRTAEARELKEDLERRVAARTAALEQANDELGRTNRELEAFSYSVSHDLRAPLRAVSGFTDLARKKLGADAPPEVTRHLDRVQRGAERMGELIDDLLQFSRVGRQSLTPSPFRLDSLVGEAVSDLPPGDREAVSWDIGELGDVVADRRLMRRVVDNLIGNAVKFSRKSPAPRVSIGRIESDGQPAYFVRDNGVGFNMAYADKLFGIFQRLHAADEFEGTGVGLSIVERVINRHGGRVWAEAAVGQGATFFFTVGEVEKQEGEEFVND